MGDVVNLNKARKERARDEKKKQAAENRTKHGQTKTEKTGISARLDQLKRALDGSQLKNNDPNATGPSRRST